MTIHFKDGTHHIFPAECTYRMWGTWMNVDLEGREVALISAESVNWIEFDNPWRPR